MTTPHTLIVTIDEAGVSEYRIECPGISDDCEAWTPCEDPAGHADGTHTHLFHGVEHLASEDEDGWSIRTGRCFIATNPQLGSAVDYAFGYLPRGRYLVEPSDHGPTFDDPHSLELMFAKDETRRPHSACSRACPVCEGTR